jgi:hypothetical protein
MNFGFLTPYLTYGFWFYYTNPVLTVLGLNSIHSYGYCRAEKDGFWAVRGKRSEPGEFANFYALRGKKSADSLSLLLEDILRVRRRAGPSPLHRHNTEN